MTAIYIAILAIVRIEKFLVNIITGNQFNIEFEQYKNANLDKAIKDFIDEIKLRSKFKNPQLAQEIENLNDDELMQQIEEEMFKKKYPDGSIHEEAFRNEIKNELNKKIRNKIQVTGFKLLSLIFKSFLHGVTKPLPEGLFNKITTIFLVKPLQVLTAPLLLIVASAMELVRTLHEVLILGVIFAPVAIKVATLIVLNAPLYALDALRFVANGIKSCLNKTQKQADENQEPHEETSSVSPSHSTKMLVLARTSSKPTNSPVEVNEYTTLFGEKASLGKETHFADQSTQYGL